MLKRGLNIDLLQRKIKDGKFQKSTIDYSDIEPFVADKKRKNKKFWKKSQYLYVIEFKHEVAGSRIYSSDGFTWQSEIRFEHRIWTEKEFNDFKYGMRYSMGRSWVDGAFLENDRIISVKMAS